MPTPETHAVLSASSAERWMHCPGSVALSKDIPESSSDYAEEGRLAHALAELKLRKKFLEPMSPRAFNTRYNKLARDSHWQPEMDACTDEYVDYITDIANSLSTRPFIAVEQRVDFSDFVPGGFGTADCILIHENTLYINDYKHGKGVPVSAENNPQMMLYALGAVLNYRLLCDIQSIHTAIIQPRAGGIKESNFSRDELMDWAAFTVRPAAEKAADPDCDEFHSGDWCRFCPAKALCRERSGIVSAMDNFGGRLPPLLSDDEVANVLSKLDPLIRYGEAVKAYAQNKIMSGGEIPGWKLVEGRGNRVWTDQTAAFEAIKAAGIEEALLYERKPLTAPALEKALGKKVFAEVATPYITKQPGKPTLAPIEDPRKPYNPRLSAAEDFQNIKEDAK